MRKLVMWWRREQYGFTNGQEVVGCVVLVFLVVAVLVAWVLYMLARCGIGGCHCPRTGERAGRAERLVHQVYPDRICAESAEFTDADLDGLHSCEHSKFALTDDEPATYLHLKQHMHAALQSLARIECQWAIGSHSATLRVTKMAASEVSPSLPRQPTGGVPGKEPSASGAAARLCRDDDRCLELQQVVVW